MFEQEFIINGTAINSTTTDNNHKFIAEELRNTASSMGGVPLLKDHDNTVESIVGRVKEGSFDEANQNIQFKASVVDKAMQQKIDSGLINSVSIGAIMEGFEEDADTGALIPKGLKIRELSLVAVPADPNATFVKAMTEASTLFNTNKKSNDSLVEQLKGGSDKLKEEQTPSVSVEAFEALKKELKESMEANAKISADLINSNTELKDSNTELKAKLEAKAEKVEVKVEAKAVEEKVEEVEEVEEAAEVINEGYNVIQGQGSLSGGSFEVVRSRYR